MPPDVRTHLLNLDINNTGALAKKADSLFQSHQSLAVKILSADLPSTPSSHPSRELAVTVHPPLFPPTLQAIPALLKLPTATEDPPLLSLSPAGTTRHMKIMPINARNPAPVRKTQQLAGRNVFSPRQILILTPLPFPSGLQSLFFVVPSPGFIFQLRYLPTDPP